MRTAIPGPPISRAERSTEAALPWPRRTIVVLSGLPADPVSPKAPEAPKAATHAVAFPCERCGDVTLDGDPCTCRRPFDPVDVSRRHRSAVARARHLPRLAGP